MSALDWLGLISSSALNFEMLSVIEVGETGERGRLTILPMLPAASCSFIYRVPSLPTSTTPTPLSSSKLRSSSFSFCHCAHSNPKNPITDSILSPIFRGVKGFFARSQAQRWSFCLPPTNVVWEGGPGENGGSFLQSGGFGVALLSITTNAKHRISPFVATLASNPTFISGFCGLFFAQLIKVLINFFVERKWDWRIMFASGGMPSSHSALCTALTTSVALCHGVADSLFPVSLGFSLIVMYDAIGVRRHAGMQAEVLNMIVADLFQGHPISQRKLKELLGHTPSQVLAGALFGILVACVCCQDSLIGA